MAKRYDFFSFYRLTMIFEIQWNDKKKNRTASSKFTSVKRRPYFWKIIMSPVAKEIFRF